LRLLIYFCTFIITSNVDTKTAAPVPGYGSTGKENVSCIDCFLICQQDGWLKDWRRDADEKSVDAKSCDEREKEVLGPKWFSF
jgi:hypothetical protein